MGALIGVDIGTGGVRCLAIDEEGQVLAAADETYPSHSPRPGWSEQEPEHWWKATRNVIKRTAAQVSGDVAAVGLAGQMHGAVFLDRNDDVIRPALLWNDQRTAAQCAAITELVGADRLKEITGNPALTGFQAPKILWLREAEPECYARVASVLLPKDFVRLRLTGDHATDVSDASGTLLMDLRRRSWSSVILEALDIQSAWMPPVFESPQPTGAISVQHSEELGLAAGTPVAAGAGDNAAAAVGMGVVAPGLASCSIGTSGVMFAHADAPQADPSGRIHTFCHAVPGRYHHMGVTLSAGAALRWWRDVAESTDFDALMRLAGNVSPGAEGLLFLPYLSGERTPHLDPRARAAFVGLTTRHGLAHMTRAVVEGVAFSLRESLDIMVSLGIDVREIRATGGGARSTLWRQVLADVLGRPIVRTAVDEGPAYGAALLAGVTVGTFDNVEQACSVVKVNPEMSAPDPVRARLYDEHYSVYRSLYPATAPAMHQLSMLASPERAPSSGADQPPRERR
ncbi:MAG TPA: xylulokinase [Candidatus Dormibacteraeota bacterium]|nr:xylulokinase [Candidatus Dormibacteraeota bacterium]